jgi:exopolyphosphatase/guanosine-5'-triphosphate,3'-diphosphate pyrophosphatase
MSESRRVAVLDLGTNSTRLLVAEVQDGEVTTLERQSTVTRLGEGVDASGRLSDEAMQRVLDVVEEYRGLADEHDAAERIAVATSATRDAENGPDLEREIRDRFGFEIEIISGDEEARLTFMGATAGRDGDEPALVIDVGGGSTEFVVGVPGRAPDFHVSTNLGSVRQSERHIEHDPPRPDELEALARAAREIIAEGVPAEHRLAVSQGIAVAGTATSLASIDLALEPYDPAKVDGHRLTREACERMLASLAALPLDERREVTGLHPDRAETIVAGTTILIAAMETFGLDAVEVTEADIMHGAALSHAAG